MAGQPEMRAKKERALLDGDTTEQETPVKPKRDVPKELKKYQTRERMLELVRIREEKRARGETVVGRPRTKFSKAEREQAALEKLMPKALKVLEEQLDDKDPRVRQSAAIKVIEYRKGKPTQMVKQEIDQRISAIRFETAAVGGAMLPPAIDLPTDDYETHLRLNIDNQDLAEAGEDGDGEAA
jgi:hypothetical protein